MATGKKQRAAKEKVDSQKLYPLEDAVAMAVQLKHTKFDETVDLAMRLGVDPKHADQMVRGSVVLPHGTGKTIRVLAIAKGEKEAEARAAGADFVGAEDMVEKIQGGWLEFDAIVATPDTMGLVGRLGKVLGPRGLMPSPKTGSVTMDIAKAVGDLKAGKVEYRVDRAGNVHSIVGKSSFPVPSLIENARVLIDAVVKARPAAAKGHYVKRIALSTTMGPGIHIDHTKLVTEVQH